MGSRRRKPGSDFSPDSSNQGQSLWYDATIDANLIEASFAKQYGIRLSIEDIQVSEYYRLLGGLMEDTPLGAIIAIRSEENQDVLKSFSPEKRRIRDQWRLHIAGKQYATMSQEAKKKNNSALKALFMQLADFKPNERR